MTYKIIRNDITHMKTDAIVNAANTTLLGGGGVDGAIHRAAGRGLLEECRKAGGCEPGHAVMTGGYDLPAKHVIHTVGPVWQGGNAGEEETLRSCWRECLRIADENGFESIAFPLISAGAYGYPGDEALRIAAEEASLFLKEHDMEIILVIYDSASLEKSRRFSDDIREYIDEHYVEAHPWQRQSVKACRPGNTVFGSSAKATVREEAEARYDCCFSLEDAAPMIFEPDESFTEMLLRKIDEKGITDAACYKKANLDRKLFSKIRSDIYYHPSKQTAVALAIALELDIQEAEKLLMKAGYAFSDSYLSDVIVRYFIEKKNYDIFTINNCLFEYDQPVLGC